ncbi:phosphoglycerate mutase-like protein [Suhomyces tanzawaensis NRRL Y-17324]|uniref:Phosphoglycerate mutase-like protein n=1 Tax=Suhomyces tanzawaensis NRRL Y-17324 TaxID=984487 RepID=A0A1E4SNE9_9ASCO|nr:phosphoglycerate mutase-like protein [Suhomyces tanzawaensis NRRL Y-17324]ODV80947.1 phosphoglycerate mutase-like protein [Suhomyces tanzawaensis NRRL Y-17324]
MSLLIPTENDYDDAHGDLAEEQVYREKYAAIKDSRDGNGRLNFPWTYEVVPGFFRQSDDATDDRTFNHGLEHFGRAKPWAQIKEELFQLNKAAGPNESYKLVFFARHGQGYHNVCVLKYGVEEWDRKWHSMETDGEIVFGPDPELTELGINQAKENNAAWKQEIAEGCPLPSKFYVSPMQRSSQTLVYTWAGIKPKEPRPLVRETIRERLGRNLCDKRSTRTVIAQRFPDFVIPEDYPEEDQLYKDDYREKLHEQSFRVMDLLKEVFEDDVKDTVVDRVLAHENTFVSTTSHAGVIRAFILALGHRQFTICTGGMIPIVIKGTRRE